MEAPDKIYIQPNAHDRWFEGNKPNDIFVEYIRRDVLVDKLYKWMDKDTTVTDYYSKEDFKKVIDNLF